MNGEVERLYDARLAKALSHPLRARILERLERETASPSDLADLLEAPLGNVSYHVRILAEAGLIELVRTTRRRGATEHHYRAVASEPVERRDGRDLTTARPHAGESSVSPAPAVPSEPQPRPHDVAAGPPATGVDPVRDTIAEVRRHVRARGGADAGRAHVTRLTLVLDDEAWSELKAAIESLHDLALRVQIESAPRLRRTGHEHEREANLVLMLFDGADPEALRVLRGGVGERRRSGDPSD
jgi:DNA-binding transcriptional ArsR family regulator